MNNPYPNLRPVGLRPLPSYLHGSHLDAVLRLCESVRRRTGEIAWFDVPRRQVCFGHTFPSVGLPRIVLAVPLFEGGRPIRFDPAIDEWTEDTVVRFLHYANASASQKEQWRDAKERSRTNDEAQAKGLAAQESAEAGVRYADRAYERYSMGKHYRRTASVGS